MINQMVAELRMIESRTRRQWEDDAAERANNREYNLSPESKDALARGDRQRKSGVYETNDLPEVTGDNFTTRLWRSGYMEPCHAELFEGGMFGVHMCNLDKGHAGSHQCVAVGFCNKTWR